MSMLELEHLCLLDEKLLVAPILGLLIAPKVIGEGAHVLMMIIPQMLNIKNNNAKAPIENLEGTHIVKQLQKVSPTAEAVLVGERGRISITAFLSLSSSLAAEALMVLNTH